MGPREFLRGRIEAAENALMEDDKSLKTVVAENRFATTLALSGV
jgi:AraC-like DNA-binding protein